MSRKRILVAEDEESLLKLQTIFLTSRGYEVEGVTDGFAAIDAVQRQLPDLILLDIMLPGLDGFEVCHRIKENQAGRNIPVVMLTAKKGAADREKGLAAGAAAYITKPFRTSEVLALVEKLLVSSNGH
jgi:twitching motility two-component system response regulator PilG